MQAWRWFIGLVLLCTAAIGWAADLEVSGFGTLSAYQGDSDAVAVKPRNTSLGASRGGHWRFDGDSVLAVQARGTLNEDLQAVWQVQATDDVGYRFRPRTEWLHLGWRLNPAWSLRLGRQPLSVLQYSETRNVGLARVTTRPMAAVYVLTSITPVDGANLSWNGDVAGGVLMVDIGGGHFNAKADVGRAPGKVASLYARWQSGALTLRAGVSPSRLDLVNSTLSAQLAPLRAPGGPCANCDAVFSERLQTENIKLSLYNMGLSWNLGHGWALDGEAVRRTSSSLVTASADGWYLLLSRRVDLLTPYVAYGETRYRDRPLGLKASPGAPAPVAASLAALDQRLQQPLDRSVALLGVRWFVHEQVSLKLQLERWQATRDTRTPRSYEILLPAGTENWNGRVHMLSANLDFVF